MNVRIVKMFSISICLVSKLRNCYVKLFAEVLNSGIAAAAMWYVCKIAKLGTFFLRTVDA
jgi:hypothetical protein